MTLVPYDYSPIVARPPLRWPEGARLAIWVIANIEHFEAHLPGTATNPSTARLVPDVHNYAWRDYGVRVGVWRLMEILDTHRIRSTVALNAAVCQHYPLIVQEGQKRGWEFMGHGMTNSRGLPTLSLASERKVIREATEVITAATGVRPRGWLGPGLGETAHTLDLLVEAGYTYVADWCNDDQPYRMRLKHGTLLSVPYTVELNDIPLFVRKGISAREFEEILRDQFDVLYREGAHSGRVMAIALHPFVTGLPFRAKYLDRAFAYFRKHDRVWFTTGGEIAAWYQQLEAWGEVHGGGTTGKGAKAGRAARPARGKGKGTPSRAPRG